MNGAELLFFRVGSGASHGFFIHGTASTREQRALKRGIALFYHLFIVRTVI